MQRASDRCHVTIASASKAPCFRHNWPCCPSCLPETSSPVCPPWRQREDYFGNMTELSEVEKKLDLQPASSPFFLSREERKTKKTSEHSVNLARHHISDCPEEQWGGIRPSQPLGLETEGVGQESWDAAGGPPALDEPRCETAASMLKKKKIVVKST